MADEEKNTFLDSIGGAFKKLGELSAKAQEQVDAIEAEQRAATDGAEQVRNRTKFTKYQTSGVDLAMAETNLSKSQAIKNTRKLAANNNLFILYDVLLVIFNLDEVSAGC